MQDQDSQHEAGLEVLPDAAEAPEVLGVTGMAAAPPGVQVGNVAPVAQAPEAGNIPAASLREALAAAMKDKDLSAISLSELRCTVAAGLGLSADGLDCRKSEIRNEAHISVTF